MNRAVAIGVLTVSSVGFLASGNRVRAQSNATSITGFYYTGEASTGGGDLSQGANTPNTANSGTNDVHWIVTYASTNGGATSAGIYDGVTYVINTSNTTFTESQYPDPPWAGNTTSAEWITAPGALWEQTTQSTGTGAINSGGDGLPGYGVDTAPPAYTGNTHSVIYVYSTTFTIGGTGGTGAAVTGLTIQLSVSADNSFAVFVNPASSAAALATSTANYVSPDNAYSYSPLNVSLTSGFVIGVNTISIEVQNAGTANNDTVNYSGLLVYGTNFVGLPELGGWLPLAAAAGAYALWVWRRSRLHAAAPLTLASL
jgi:hypothetical protein